ncbi:prolipoprotein diacylglyceryl transferase [Spirochaeta isovalerica]|uniref:Phosphatidylglycerol--prolipoprotein diacylglyceryl transferase n=1 Tax=Spirochaeta isovalerica TaxID=150 RepID=A0A841RJ80_9SPIO|nr:prolipoprotein diacylglyceryl transferase [Spirochaeta isovalerica]MBB6482352.1 phosphatidylglycerol:prolipoprotein diacylglycerol transferase [Spirochaeta isovalerica]
MLYISFPTWLKPEIIPGLPVRWYGLMYLIAFAIAFYLFKYQVKEKKIDVPEDDVVNFIFWTIIGLIIGARIFAALVYDTTGIYRSKPWLIFWPFYNGQFVGLQGMSYHGGVIGGVVGAVIYTKVKKYNTLLWGDMLTAAIPLGYTFGRLGNFINGELYGRVTTSPLGIVFPHAQRFSTSLDWVRDTAARIGMDISGMNVVNLPRHPSQLYEALFEGIILWAILWFIVRKRKPFNGFVISAYMIGYGVFRFFIEYMREPDAGMDFPLQWGASEAPNYLLTSFFNFSTGQILCFIMILSGTGMNLFLYFRKKNSEKIVEKPINKGKNDMRKLKKKIK